MAYKSQIVEKFATLITAAFGFIAALAWNNAVQSLFAFYFPEQKDFFILFFYAIFVTILAIIVTLWIGKLSSKFSNSKTKTQK